jgi:dipeptidyl aminopeptidase/acylaminoacyl peptidase
VINLLSFTGTTDIPGFIPSYFGGEFWEEPDLYKERSPIHFAHKITVPCLIQHCEGDIRVPLGQALELYQALQRNEIPVRLQVMPRQGHLPLEPMAWLRFMEANLEWFDTWLK